MDLGDAAGHANVGAKAMTLIHSALADGDSIDDADALRAGSSAAALGHAVSAPSTLGTFLRSFTWGHVRQLDKVSGRLLGRAFAAGAGPGDGPVTVDVDSSICETYGRQKQGGAKFTYNHVRGYHPLWRRRDNGCYVAPRIMCRLRRRRCVAAALATGGRGDVGIIRR